MFLLILSKLAKIHSVQLKKKFDTLFNKEVLIKLGLIKP